MKKETQRKHIIEPLFRGGRRVLGDGLGALRDGVLGEFTGEDQTDTVALLEKEIAWCENGRWENTYEVWISRDEMVDFLL